jgi:phage I-like protein
VKPASINGQLISFAISNGARDAKNLPSRLKLLNWGVNKTVKGDVTVGAETLRQLNANQKSGGFEHVALDFNHQTVPNSATFQKDPVKVAAYGTPEVVEGDGLYLNITEWTDAGREHAASYRDLSPTPLLDKNGEVIFLHSAALCRQGAVEDLTFYNVSDFNSLKPPTAPAPMVNTPNPLDPKASLTKLLNTLGVQVKDGATDAEIIEAANNFKPAAAAAANPDVTALSADLAAFRKDFTEFQTSREQGERDALVALASSQGKVIPLTADQIKTTSLTTLGAIVANLPSTVPMSERGKSPAEKKAPLTALSAEQKKICANLRIPEDKYLLQLKADAPADLVTV